MTAFTMSSVTQALKRPETGLPNASLTGRFSKRTFLLVSLRTCSGTSMCSLGSFCGPATAAKASALMPNSSMRWNQDRPAFKIAVVNCSKNLIDLLQRMLLDEWRNFHFAGHDQFEGGRVEFWRTSPVAKTARVIRHEIGQSDLRLVHGEADHAQCGAVIE